MKTSMVITLLVGYLIILLVVIAYLVRRSYLSQNGYLSKFNHHQNNYYQVKESSGLTTERAPQFRKTGHVKLKHPEPLPYSFEVVKAQSSSVDESRFYTELSRTHMNQHKLTSTLWTVPNQQQDSLQERRKAPQLFIECVDEDFQQHKQKAIMARSRSPRKSASDELKENSTNNFKEENIYQAYHDIESNELTCFNESLSRSDSCRSLFEESESSSSHSTPSSSRTNSSKLKSPLPIHKQQQHHHQRHHSFEKMPLRSKEESSSFKEKLKQKLSRSFSSGEFS